MRLTQTRLLLLLLLSLLPLSCYHRSERIAMVTYWCSLCRKCSHLSRVKTSYWWCRGENFIRDWFYCCRTGGFNNSLGLNTLIIRNTTLSWMFRQVADWLFIFRQVADWLFIFRQVADWLYIFRQVADCCIYLDKLLIGCLCLDKLLIGCLYLLWI